MAVRARCGWCGGPGKCDVKVGGMAFLKVREHKRSCRNDGQFICSFLGVGVPGGAKNPHESTLLVAIINFAYLSEYLYSIQIFSPNSSANQQCYKCAVSCCQPYTITPTGHATGLLLLDGAGRADGAPGHFVWKRFVTVKEGH